MRQEVIFNVVADKRNDLIRKITAFIILKSIKITYFAPYLNLVNQFMSRLVNIGIRVQAALAALNSQLPDLPIDQFTNQPI